MLSSTSSAISWILLWPLVYIHIKQKKKYYRNITEWSQKVMNEELSTKVQLKWNDCIVHWPQWPVSHLRAEDRQEGDEQPPVLIKEYGTAYFYLKWERCTCAKQDYALAQSQICSNHVQNCPWCVSATQFMSAKFHSNWFAFVKWCLPLRTLGSLAILDAENSLKQVAIRKYVQDG